MTDLFSDNKVQWSSRWAFLMAAVGSSVGLGNLWRFSSEAGQNGGGAFIILYLACVVFLGIPVLIAEYIIGRSGNGNSAIHSVNDIARRSGVSQKWGALGWTGMIASFLTVSFYCVVAAWIVSYLPKFLLGAFDGQNAEVIAQQFGKTRGNYWGMSPKNLGVFWAFSGFALLTIWLVARGVNDGIEKATKILMPLFFILLVGLSLYSLWLGASTKIITQSGEASNGMREAVLFLFTPDWSALSPSIAARAMGQAFFSISLGSAIMITYGSYLPKSISIPKSAVTVALADTAVALIAGLAIFPIVFSYGLDVKSGAGLFFETLPIALSSTLSGKFVGTAFFCLAIFAAVSSSISLIEPSVAWVKEKFNLSRKSAAMTVGGAMWLLGLCSIFVSGFMDFLDVKLTAAVLLPLTGFLTVLFVGWRMKYSLIKEELSDLSPILLQFLFVMLRYVAPILVFVILVLGVDDAYFGGVLSKALKLT